MDDLISVIIPVYKVEKYLEKSIESVLGQSYSNLEIILVDDGSPDGCPTICDAYQKKYDKVKVIHKENGGLSSARNAGIDIASGKYIAFIDSDDTVHRDFIRILHDLCESYDCDIAQCDFLETKETSLFLSPQCNRKEEVYSTVEAMKDFCKDSNVVKYWVAWNKLYRRELFDGIRYPLGRTHEDMFTSHKLLYKSRRTVVTNLYLYYYLQRDGSITRNEEENMRNTLDKVEALNELVDFFREKELNDELEYMLYKFYFTAFSAYQIMAENKESQMSCSSFDRGMKELVGKVNLAKKMILDLSSNDLSVKLASIYPSLSEEEQKIYRDTYGMRITKEFERIYGLPFEKISFGSRVAIYAAGHVGQSYYKQLAESHYAHVVVWVDNSWKVYTDFEIPVEPIDALFQHEFDWLLVAIENEMIAKEVIDNLVGWGIDRKKIIFEHPQPVFNNNKLRSEFMSETNKIDGKGGQRRWFMMNTPDHDNLGDHALTIGTLEYMHDYFPNEQVIEITGRQWDTCKEQIIPKINTDDIIVIVGGGFMGDLWPVQDSRVKQIIEALGNNRIIFFPQTFYYDGTKDSVIESDRLLYNDKKNILFIHREINSYKWFIKNVVSDFDRNLCFPDLALYLNFMRKTQKREGVLLCLRLDKESISNEVRAELLSLARDSGRSVAMIDSLLDRSVGRYERIDKVDEILNKISESELLITDRLHPMIFATVTGTPCIALDNISGKVSGVYDWISGFDYITYQNHKNINKDLIKDYLNKKDRCYDRSVLDSKFSEMYNVIKHWVGGENAGTDKTLY